VGDEGDVVTEVGGVLGFFEVARVPSVPGSYQFKVLSEAVDMAKAQRRCTGRSCVESSNHPILNL
jgi:hypothetical protein